MIKELDLVVLARDLPADKLKSGDAGTVVMVHGANDGYEVEFATITGDTLTVATLPRDAVRAVKRNEIAHVRNVA